MRWGWGWGRERCPGRKDKPDHTSPGEPMGTRLPHTPQQQRGASGLGRPALVTVRRAAADTRAFLHISRSL